MINRTFFILIVFISSKVFAQKDLISLTKSGELVLTKAGASYFANLSLKCTNSVYPHSYSESFRMEGEDDFKKPNQLWPSFTGCYDWHSAVHNHWALVKILKSFPNLPEANSIRQKLENSFDSENIKKELSYFTSHEYNLENAKYEFEFPYGRSWFLKLVEELLTWDNADARRWVTQLQPLTDYIVNRYLEVWPGIEKPTFSGSHNSSALGISFALDYAKASHNEQLTALMSYKARSFYMDMQEYQLADEPYDYDFMSAGLLVADLMRKVMSADDYDFWLSGFCKNLYSITGLDQALTIKKVEKHDGYESHWDGFHLNRIWCLNGILKSLPENSLRPEIKKAIYKKQLEMWNYAQASIGKGNYDIDHWLSSFSVFAIMGYSSDIKKQ